MINIAGYIGPCRELKCFGVLDFCNGSLYAFLIVLVNSWFLTDSGYGFIF